MVWAVFLCGAEGWTIKSDKNRIEALEMWCWRKMLGDSWREHRTNKSILDELDVERELMAKVVKFGQYFGHVARGSAGQLALTVLEGSMEGTRFQGKPKRHRRLDGVRVHSAKGDVSGQRAMEEEDTGMVSCCRQRSEEEGRLERESYLFIEIITTESMQLEMT